MTNLSGTNLNNGAAVGPQGEGMDSPSTFPTYPAYKDSGVEWLGEVPVHWKEKPFFSLVSERCESNAGMKQENLLSLSYGRIVNKDINSLDGLLPASFETYQVVHPGDIVFRLTDLQNDKRSLRSAIVREAGIVTSAYLAGVCRGIFPEFASFLFRAYDSIKVFYSMGGGLRQSMKYSDMKWLPIFLPEWQEQTQIARFLDHETARIDALIEEQQRLIELLKEKRQAVISHAVARGLDPTVPMKDSGVEWLGEVPAHWAFYPIKHLALLNPRKSGFAGDTGQLCSFLPMDKLKTGVIVLDEERLIEEVIGGYTYFEDGDVLQAKVTPCFENRNIAVAKGLTNGIGFGSSEINVLRPFSGVSAEYLYYRLQEDSYMSFCTANMIGAGGLKRVPTDVINNFKVALPELSEQIDIAKYLDRVTMRINNLIEHSEGGVTLLQERRSALISAAVTGKIDVRGWQPPASTQAPESAVAEAN